ncbi:riboflavin biosynthesis protein PYRD, chloroplastic-like [Primulina huaijiensis]|uniref:riboflavin biosynthesis protein PYRD, chloroplastic-like n=1 Tax=Primulina huaijiensis TaxID=1492673 RepID=UPI003CC6DE68
MYTQTFLFLNHICYHPPIIQQNKLVFSPNLKSGLCSSAPRVSESGIISRNGGCLTVIRRGASQIKQELNQEEKCSDECYMRRCVGVARKAIGCTSPNPMVGCVIVRDGKIIGEGFHPKAGQPHAEVFALRDAGDLAENGIAYVSLEPCNHYGRTPPCTEALIKAKVKKVVVGMVDPNPIVASAGVKRLQEAGIEVIVGVEEELCKRLNEAYIHQMLTGKPFVTLRYSLSLGGNMLDQLGENAMERGEYYSKLLQEYDAVILSSTALANKSVFPVSSELGANQPLKIVLSKSANPLIQNPDLPTDAASKLPIITEKELKELENGQEEVHRRLSDRMTLAEILEHCKRKGLCSVLVDLMGDHTDFEDILKEGFDEDLFQKVVVEILPIWGGNVVKALNIANMKTRVKNLTSRISGESVIVEGYIC